MFCSGFFGQPALSRRTADGITAFVNGRFVRDRGITQAVRIAYEGMVDRGRHPVATVFVDLPPHAVDVNVHPMKIEVRFHDASAVFRAVRRAVATSLAAAPWVGGAPAPAVAGSGNSGTAGSGAAASAPVAEPAAPQPALPVRSYTLHENTSLGPRASWGSAFSASQPVAGRAAFVGGTAYGVGEGAAPPVHGASAPAGSDEAPPRDGFFTSLHYIGSFRGTYLIASDADGIVVVDQHAAHERITFELLRDTWRERRAVAQPLLVPQVIRLDPVRIAALEENTDFFGTLGFDVAPFGGNDVAIQAVPSILGRARVEPLLRDALDELAASGQSGRVEQAVDAVLLRMACHGSVRAGDALGPREAHALFEQLDRVDFGGNCPHGRPVWFRMSLAELEKRFDHR